MRVMFMLSSCFPLRVHGALHVLVLPILPAASPTFPCFVCSSRMGTLFFSLFSVTRFSSLFAELTLTLTQL